MQRSNAAERRRVIEWEDPLASAAQGAELSGLEYMRALADGEIPPPPIALLMDLMPIEVEEGKVTFASTPGEHHYNPIGMVHGGLAATLLDSAMGCAVQTTLPAGTGYTTLELKVNFVRAMSATTGRVLCEATVLHRGGRVATAEAKITAEETGKLVAHGTSTCLLLG